MTRAINMVGKRFEGCVVISREGSNKDKKATWRCVCKCGKEFVTTGKSIRLKLIKSCGCLKISRIKEVGFKNKTHGETKTRLYNIWHGMKKRCRTKSDTSFKYYGGKGISVCDEWESSYEVFRDWANANGYEDNLTLDRLDNNGDYSPENCKWSDLYEQARNRSNNVRVDFKGENMTLSQVAENLGISTSLLQYRINRGLNYDGTIK